MISSPCINICKMDSTTGLCIGCFRTIDEITVWSRIDDPARARILGEVEQRRRELDAKRPPNPTTRKPMNEQDEERYQCVGICMADPDSGYCLGCGRPPLAEPGIVAELVKPTPTTGSDDKPEQAE